MATRSSCEVAQDAAAQRSPRDHPLDRLAEHPIRVLTLEDLRRGALLDAAGVAGMPVVRLLVALVAGQPHLFGVDHDDVVAAVDMRGVAGLVLAAQSPGEFGGQPAEHHAVGVDHVPPLVDLGRLHGVGFHQLPRPVGFGAPALLGGRAVCHSIVAGQRDSETRNQRVKQDVI
jgi:hypothetical protein